ncbi:MAG TPA: tRNA lysidine(34) synthetase TilS [Chryseosolibacter sp.]
MVEQLLLHIQRHQLCKTTDKILLAVSGGVDSMVMLDLFRQVGFQIGVAHCNFQLRADDSAADESLVQRICLELHIPFYSRRFDTASFAEEHGLSIQVAARQLRYNFFAEVARNNGYAFIATAHHLNDSIETVLLNLARGTGIQGLSGIAVKNDRIIRPMLFATREQIVRYAENNSLEWREDTSNAHDDYQRNFIRHHLTPLFLKLNPNFEKTFQKNMERISGAFEMVQLHLGNFRKASIHQRDGVMHISKPDLKTHVHGDVLLWELLKSKGFNYEQCCDMLSTSQPGKQFLTPSHRVLADRDFFIVTERDETAILNVLIERGQEVVSNGYEELRLSMKSDGVNTITHDSSCAQWDASKITFPLRWRKWEEGDTFQPLGMKGHKKLSDFLIDCKIPIAQKERVTVVESGGRIVWVVGLRISDDAKITSSTSASLEVKVVKSEVEKIS